MQRAIVSRIHSPLLTAYYPCLEVGAPFHTNVDEDGVVFLRPREDSENQPAPAGVFRGFAFREEGDRREGSCEGNGLRAPLARRPRVACVRACGAAQPPARRRGTQLAGPPNKCDPIRSQQTDYCAPLASTCDLNTRSSWRTTHRRSIKVM